MELNRYQEHHANRNNGEDHMRNLETAYICLYLYIMTYMQNKVNFGISEDQCEGFGGRGEELVFKVHHNTHKCRCHTKTHPNTKASHTLITGHGETNPILTLKFSLCWLPPTKCKGAFHIARGEIHEISCPAVTPVS